MDNKEFSQYALLQNKNYRITIPLTTLIAFILLLVIDYCCRPIFVFHKWEATQVQLYWQIIPVMLLTFLAGYSMGSLVVLLYFTVVTMNKSLAYHAFMLLISSLVMNLPIYHRWFLSIKKTILADIILIISLGPAWNILLGILQGADFEMFHTEGHVFFLLLLPAPSCTFVCFICYCYHRFLPERIKNLFFATASASDMSVEFRKRLKAQKRPKISTKITVMIVGVAGILLISAYGISSSLFADEIRKPLYEAGQNAEEWFDWRTIVFATRMVVLMLIVAVPAILVAIGSTNSMITNPLILMSMALEDSAESEFGKGQVDIRNLGIKSRDEIGILYGALVHSYDVLDEYLKNLEREKRLSTDLEIAKEANKAKDLFLSSMSHEIRTPINAVLGLDEMILRESKEDEILNYAADIQTAGKNLLSIVNEILDFSKIEAGRMEIIPVEYDLSSSINDLMNMISKRAEDKGLSLNLKVDENIPHLLEGDEIRIKQCVLNILTNAVKYTEKGSVSMNVTWEKISEEKIGLTFHVIDTGIGIKEEDIPKLFTAFQRIEEKRNRTIEGTGLGMNIVQQLLGLMGTSLQVKSEYGHGSDFYFTVEQKVISWEPLGDIEGAFCRVRQREAARGGVRVLAPEASILVVDDTRLNLTVARGLLKQTRAFVDTAESGAETLELVCRKKYDLIFLDHRMPVMDGIETLAAMKKLAGNLNQNTACIALTANAIAGAREMYLQAGFDDYLTKPIDSEKLEKMLSKYLPAEKVQVIEPSVSDGAEGEVPADSPLNIEGIDYQAALANCGGREILLSAMKEFYAAIDDKSELIEKYASEQDWKNYTVLVHALKSSARLIGALKLSSDAARLEECGDAENSSEIAEKTPALLSLYRSYKEGLAPFAVSDADSGSAAEAKEEISREDFLQALSNIKECVQAFDFSTADQIISMLDSYRIPEAEEERYQKIKEKLSAVDQAEILKLL